MVLRDGIWGTNGEQDIIKMLLTHLTIPVATYEPLQDLGKSSPSHQRCWFRNAPDSNSTQVSRLSRYMFDAAGRIQNGVLYLPSLHQEMAPLLLIETAVRYISRFRQSVHIDRSSWVSCGSTTDLKSCPTNSIDYVFTDPPFGTTSSTLNSIFCGNLGFAYIQILHKRL